MSENSTSHVNPIEDVEDIEKLLEMRRILLAELEGDEENDDEEAINTGNDCETISQFTLSSGGWEATKGCSMNSHCEILSDGFELNDEEKMLNTEDLMEEENFLAMQDSPNEHNEREAENMDGYSSLSSSEEDEEIDEEIDELLEKAVGSNAEYTKNASKRFKRVLEFRGTDHFDVLPDGWVEVTHNSGLPVYLHRPSRSCTFSRPYFLGPGSLRSHRVPESAIPCYHQKKLRSEAEKGLRPENQAGSNEEGAKEVADREPQTSVGQQQSQDKCPRRSEILDKLNAPIIKVKTAKDILNSQLTSDALYDYAKNSFRFKNVHVYRFGKWSEARNFFKDKKRTDNEQRAIRGDTSRPGLPGNVQLITVPSFDNESKPHQKGFYLNPQGKTSISILHEIVQKVLKCTVKYMETETRSCATPYHCIARLKTNPPCANQPNKALTSEGIRQKLQSLKEYYYQLNQTQQPNIAQVYGYHSLQRQSSTFQEDEEYITISEGYGNSKKLAKLDAARKAVENLIPLHIDFDEDGMAVGQNTSATEKSSVSNISNLEIFDHIKINDTRVPELCARTNQPTPYLILQECLKRSAVFGDTELSTESKRLRHHHHEFKLNVGKHAIKVYCSNKREGKQKAAQRMIAEFHPNVTTWGGILRIYGYEAQQKQREARKSKESIIKLQGEVKTQNERNRHTSLEANPVILEKLRSEMLKLSEKLVQKTLIQQPNLSLPPPPPPPKHLNNGLEGPPKKKRKKRKATCNSLLDVQPDKFRPLNLDFTQPPILSEEQLIQMSAKLAELHPEHMRVPAPCLEL